MLREKVISELRSKKITFYVFSKVVLKTSFNGLSKLKNQLISKRNLNELSSRTQNHIKLMYKWHVDQDRLKLFENYDRISGRYKH